MQDSKPRSIVEQEHVDECPHCPCKFIGMTPDEAREHIRDYHSEVAGAVAVFPEHDDMQTQTNLEQWSYD